MLKFYLGNTTNENNRIYVDTNSTITEIADSFNLGTIDLEWNLCKEPIFPKTQLTIIDDTTNEKWVFIVCQDDVEIVKKTTPITYKHHLTVSQNTHELNYPLLRNTIFSQPYTTEKVVSKKSWFYCDAQYSNGTLQSFDTTAQFKTDKNADPIMIRKSLFPITLKNADDLKNIYFIPTTTLAEYLTYTINGTAPEETIIGLTRKNPYENQYISRMKFYIRFGTSSHQSREITFTSSDIGHRVYLSNEIKNWFIENINEKFYIVFDNTYGNVQDISSTFTDVSGRTGWLPKLFGLVNLEFHFDFYYYSLYDVLDIIEKQAEKRRNGITHYDPFYKMPSKSSLIGQVLSTIKAPEFNFTGIDLYTAVAQVMSYIDAYPTLSEDKTLGFVYLNDLSNETITTENFVDKKSTLNEQNFTNRLVSSYQNAKQENAKYYPAKNTFRKIGYNGYGVASDPNNYWFLLDQPIDYLDHLYIRSDTNLIVDIYLYSTTGSTGILSTRYKWIKAQNYPYIFENNAVDIASMVFESSVYNQLEEGSAYVGLINRNTTLYYSKGDNKIYAGITGQIGIITDEDVVKYAIKNAVNQQLSGAVLENTFTYTKAEIRYNVVYHAIYNGRVAQESSTNKQEGETQIAQGNAGAELKRLGNNLQGIIAKLGNEQVSVALPITRMKDRIKVGTIWQDDNYENWIVNRVQTTFTTNEDKVIVNATFTKNFNALAQYTSLDQEKRFYEISSTLTSKGYENINEYLYFTNRDIDVSELATSYCSFTNNALKIIVGTTLGQTDLALADYNKNFDLPILMTLIPTSTGQCISQYTALPCHTYGSGNMLCFEMGFDSPINAGDKVVIEDNKRVSQTTLYTEENGFADAFSINCKARLKNSTTLLEDYPRLSTYPTGIDLFNLSNYYYYKKPNEILHLNYGLACLPYYTATINNLRTPIYKYDEIFFGDSFINENSIIQNNKYDNESKVVHVWVSDEKYSITDNKAFGTDLGECSVSIEYETNCGTLTVMQNGSSVDISNYVSWCIADADGNVYIASNKRDDGFTIAKLKFFLRYKRAAKETLRTITINAPHITTYWKYADETNYRVLTSGTQIADGETINYYFYPNSYYYITDYGVHTLQISADTTLTNTSAVQFNDLTGTFAFTLGVINSYNLSINNTNNFSISPTIKINLIHRNLLTFMKDHEKSYTTTISANSTYSGNGSILTESSTTETTQQAALKITYKVSGRTYTKNYTGLTTSPFNF